VEDTREGEELLALREGRLRFPEVFPLDEETPFSNFVVVRTIHP
jgi:hypothetical protein